jgi:hypothetical protein
MRTAMKTAGSVDASLFVRGADTGAGRGESLKAGAVVFIEVRERLGPELYRIAVGSRLMTASSSAALEAGTLLRARVERSGAGLVLRMLDAGRGARDAAAQAILKAGLPLDEASRVALAALLGAGISPGGAALGRVRQAALRAAAAGREDESGLVELAARMEAKGLAADEAALDELARAGDGRSGDRSESGLGSGGGRGDGAGERGGEAELPAGEASLASNIDLESDFERAIPEDELPAGLGVFLRALVLRTAEAGRVPLESRAPFEGVSGERLGLFNHAKAKDGAWLLVPFRFALDSVAFAGNLRIQLPCVPGGPGRIEARFDASGESPPETWRASLSFGGGARPALRIADPKGAGSLRFRSLIESFEAGMAGLGFRVAVGPSGDGGAMGGGLDLDA